MEKKMHNKLKKLNYTERGKSLGLIDKNPLTEKAKLSDDSLPPTHSYTLPKKSIQGTN